MDILKRLGAVYLFLMAAVVVFLWITGAVFDNSSGDYPMWQLANWFMGLAAIPLMLLVAIVRKALLCRRERDRDGGGITREYLETNLSLAGAIVLTMYFYWNWFYSFWPMNEPWLIEDSPTLLHIHLSYWGYIHPIYVLLSLATGAWLWRRAGRKEG